MHKEIDLCVYTYNIYGLYVYILMNRSMHVDPCIERSIMYRFTCTDPYVQQMIHAYRTVDTEIDLCV